MQSVVEVRDYPGVFRLSPLERSAAMTMLRRTSPNDRLAMVPNPYGDEFAAGETRLDRRRTAVYLIEEGSVGSERFSDWVETPLLGIGEFGLEEAGWMVLSLRTLVKKSGGAGGRVLAVTFADGEDLQQFVEGMHREVNKIL